MSDSHDLEMRAWAKTAQDENDRAQELEVRLELAEKERDQAMALVNFHREPLVACQARLAAAERVVEAVREWLDHDVTEEPWTHDRAACDSGRALCDAFDGYEKTYAAVPARGEARAPEGGSTPSAAIDDATPVVRGHHDPSVWEDDPTDLNFSEPVKEDK